MSLEPETICTKNGQHHVLEKFHAARCAHRSGVHSDREKCQLDTAAKQMRFIDVLKGRRRRLDSGE